MPAVVEFAPQIELPPHKLWTREECETLEASGLIHPSSYELIEGELVLKVSKNLPHLRALMVLSAWLRSVFGDLRVAPEPSVDIAGKDFERSVPEPDLTVLSRSILELTQRPQSTDVLLAIEISDTTLAFDQGIKAKLYARAGIPEYWVLDLNNKLLIVHRNPDHETYRSAVAYSIDEHVSPLAAPEQSLLVGSLFQ
jgi:Uma2 family endonuclease